MSSLRVRSHPPLPNGRLVEVTPESAGWKYVGFTVHRLETGQRLEGGAPGREACLVLLTGIADVTAKSVEYLGIGGRQSVFEDKPPAAIYVPAGAAWVIVAQNTVEVAVCSAPGTGSGEPRNIDPERMSREVRGRGTNTRLVRNILPESEPADSLLVVEVITPAGHWSSYPPHKHDADAPPTETQLEETYYHRLMPPQGFAFQRVYTDDRSLDETISVEDGDVVMVPRGYHPVGAPHGYDLYYLNVMAGPRRNWIFHNDPAHAWIMQKS